MIGTSGMARAGFAAAATLSSVMATYLYVRGSPEWVFFASIAFSAVAQLASARIRSVREGFKARLTVDTSCLTLPLASALWLWLRFGSVVMLINAVIIALITIVYATLMFTARRLGGGPGE